MLLLVSTIVPLLPFDRQERVGSLGEIKFRAGRNKTWKIRGETGLPRSSDRCKSRDGGEGFKLQWIKRSVHAILAKVIAQRPVEYRAGLRSE